MHFCKTVILESLSVYKLKLYTMGRVSPLSVTLSYPLTTNLPSTIRGVNLKRLSDNLVANLSGGVLVKKPFRPYFKDK